MRVRAACAALLCSVFAMSPALEASGPHRTASQASGPTITKFRTSGFPLSITAGPKRSLWFTEGLGPNLHGAIGRITTGGRLRQYTRGISGHMYAGTASIAAGKDGNVWFAESSSRGVQFGFIGRITPSGKVREFHKGIAGSVNDLTAGPDGNIWFTEVVCASGCRRTYGAVGRISPSGSVQIFKQGISEDPVGITTGPDGNLWFAEDPADFRHPGKVASITPAGVVTEFDQPVLLNNFDIVVGPDGNLWLTDSDRIIRCSTHQVTTPMGHGLANIRTFSTGRPAGIVHALTPGPAKTVWFGAQAETGFTKVGRITTAGRVTRLGSGLGSPRGSFLDGITMGPDGNIWFTEAGRSSKPSIDRLRLHR